MSILMSIEGSAIERAAREARDLASSRDEGAEARVVRSSPAARSDTRGHLLISILLVLAIALGCSAERTGSRAGAPGVGDLDSEQMKTAIAEMLRMTDTLDRNRRAIELMDALDEDNLPGAIEAYETDLTRVVPHESRLFANAWAKIDPKGALDRMLDTWRYPKISFQSVEEAVYVWVNSGDAAAARAYVDPSIDSTQLQGRTPTKFMVQAVLKALAVAGEYEELTGLFESLEDDGNRQLFLTEVMIEMNRVRGLPVVREWIETIPWDSPSDLKFAALTRALDWTSKMGGQIATAWYEDIEDQPRAIELLPVTVAGWGFVAPQEALPWLAQRPESTIRDQLMRRAASGWLSRKPEEAEAWLVEHLDEPLMRDRMLVPLANFRLTQRRYLDALELAQQIPNPSERDQVLTNVLTEWSRLDSAAAEEYIADQQIGEAVVAAMRKQLEAPIRVKRRPVAKPATGEEG